MAIIEPILTLLGPQLIAYDQLGELQPRMGNRSSNNAPRNIYRTGDDGWVAVSTSAQSVAERVLRLVGRPDLIDQPWFGSGAERAEHADELDAAVGSWIGERGTVEVVRAFDKAEAAVAPVYTAADVLADPQYQALGTIAELPDEELGLVRMQNVLFRLTETPGRIRWTGPPLGAHTAEVLGVYGVDADRLAELRAAGVVR
jgi:crotonobetainyl-CoA:carnitine CoA-transferase CaiB-like acyl-CoA transferase